jgi:hypothetical protein
MGTDDFQLEVCSQCPFLNGQYWDLKGFDSFKEHQCSQLVLYISNYLLEGEKRPTIYVYIIHELMN